MTDTQRRLYGLGCSRESTRRSRIRTAKPTASTSCTTWRRRARYSMAVGFGAELGRIGGCRTCFDAPAGTTGFSPRVSLDVSRNNLWGLAHSLSLRTRASTLDQRALLNYSWPRFGGTTIWTCPSPACTSSRATSAPSPSRRQEGSAQLTQRFDKAHHPLLPLPYRRVSDERPEGHAVSDPAAFAAGARGDRFHQPGAGPPRRSARPAQGHLQYARSWAWPRALRLAAQLRALSGAQCHLSPVGQAVGVRAQHAVRRHLRVSVSRAIALDAIPLPERFFGGGGTSHRGFRENQAGPRDSDYRIPVRRHGAVFQSVRSCASRSSAKISAACSFTIWATSIPAWTSSLSG